MNLVALRAAFLAPFLFTAVACGDSGGDTTAPAQPADAGSSANEGSSTATNDGPDGGAAASDGAPMPAATIDVHGTLTSYGDAPIAGRTVRVLDAHGKHVDVVTDPAGGFAASGIATPYDVRVSPEGLTDGATVYLGIVDAAPYLHADVAMAQVGPAVATQTFNVGALVATSCAGCGVEFITKSPHGSGETSTVFQAGSNVVSVALEHQFISDGSPSEPVTLHVLIHDPARTWFRYATASLTAVAGRTSPGGLYGPDLVPVHALTVTTTQGAGVPANWQPGFSAGLTFADGSSTSIFQTRGLPTLSTNVPEIPGATLSAYSWLSDPIGDSDPTIANDVQTRSGRLPITTSAIVLPAATPLHDVVPAPKSTSSLKGPGISWTAPPSTVIQVDVVDVTRARRVAAVFTDHGAVTWQKLDALGVDLTPGEHVLSTIVSPGTSLASLVAGDPTKRSMLDFSLPGSAGYQRWPFTLSP